MTTQKMRRFAYPITSERKRQHVRFTRVSYVLSDARVCTTAPVFLLFAFCAKPFCAKPFPRRTESAILTL